MAFLQPSMRLKRVDLPTFGRPTIATMGRATGQLDGFWLPQPQQHSRGSTKYGSQSKRGDRADGGPQNPRDNAGRQVCRPVDAVEQPEGGAVSAGPHERAR